MSDFYSVVEFGKRYGFDVTGKNFRTMVYGTVQDKFELDGEYFILIEIENQSTVLIKLSTVTRLIGPFSD